MHHSAVFQHDCDTLPRVGERWTEPLGFVRESEADQFAVRLGDNETVFNGDHDALSQGGHVPVAEVSSGMAHFTYRLGDIKGALDITAFVVAREDESIIGKI